MVFDTYDNKDPILNVTTSAIDNKLWDYFDFNTSTTPLYDASQEVELKDQGPVLTAYGLLLTVGGIGNMAVLIALSKSRRRKSRVDLLMTHLAVADVSVTCGVIPLEIGWKYTNAWLAGNFFCKLLLVLRAFGLYLSSNVLVCISIDRFFAVLYPLRLPEARRRSKQMLVCAWIAALGCSLPQSVIFRVLEHPRIAGFQQCVSFGAFSSQQQEVIYNVFCMFAMYFLPLVIITVCYVCIFCEIRRSSKEFDVKCVHHKDTGHVRLRRSDKNVLERARRRTLRMTVIIVTVFALCWLPYATMAMWYMADRQSAARVSRRVQDLLFAMAVSNSCMNPLVYGSYTLDLWGNLRRFLKKTCCGSSASAENCGNAGPTSKKNKNINMNTPLETSNKYNTSVSLKRKKHKHHIVYHSIFSSKTTYYTHRISTGRPVEHVLAWEFDLLRRHSQFRSKWKHLGYPAAPPDVQLQDYSAPGASVVESSASITRKKSLQSRCNVPK